MGSYYLFSPEEMFLIHGDIPTDDSSISFISLRRYGS